MEYAMFFLTPIGTPIKLSLDINFVISFQANVSIKDGILIFEPQVNAKAEVSADIALNGVFLEVGGYIEGVFMQAEIQLILKLDVFRSVKIFLDYFNYNDCFNAL